MRPSRAVLVIGAAIIVLIAADIATLVVRFDDPARVAQRKAAPISERLVRRLDRLRPLQARTNTDRDAISTALTTVEAVLNSARAPRGSGLAEAHTRWDRAPGLRLGSVNCPAAASSPSALGGPLQFTQARCALTDLSPATAELLTSARKDREDIKRLMKISVTKPDDIYLRALDRALELLIETHETYEQMNMRLNEGFPIYDQVVLITAQFLAQDSSKTFRSPKESSQVYNNRIGSLGEQMKIFRIAVEMIQTNAETLAGSAARAFDTAQAIHRREFGR